MDRAADELATSFAAYGAWRDGLRGAVGALRDWLDAVQLLDADAARRLGAALLRLAEDRLVVAVVAEFSRGKSELINAIFFAEYGRRILPSAAGRTTMCPTELLYDDSLPPCIRALPIETRARDGATADFRRHAAEWQIFAIDIESPEGMLAAFRLVAETKRVPVAEAIRYGLYDADDPDRRAGVDAHGMVEISRWRHAIVNFPHPLLRQGLVVVDTPGLNAIGAEPELTLALVPHAHAVLFVLGADTGVTKSDLEVWRQVVGDAGASRQHLAVLNKIDGLWDALTTDSEQQAEIARQAASVAVTLGLAPERVFPVSAQKGLVAKVTGDARLLARSRLPALEAAMVDLLLPSKRSIVRTQTLAVVDRIGGELRVRLDGRARQLAEQLDELRRLDGKNESAVQRLRDRAAAERTEFDRHVRHLLAARAVLNKMSREVLARVGRAGLHAHVAQARRSLRGSLLSAQVAGAVRAFFDGLRQSLRAANEQLREIETMVLGVQRVLGAELGASFAPPLAFTLDAYLAELEGVDAASRSHFGPLAALTRDKWTLIERFVDIVVAQGREIFDRAERDTEAWIGSLLPPIETQLREQRTQLARRVEALTRVRGAREALRPGLEQLDEALYQTRDKRQRLQALLDRCHAAADSAS